MTPADAISLLQAAFPLSHSARKEIEVVIDDLCASNAEPRADDRDAEIAALIRKEMAKTSADIERLAYERGSPNDAYLQGRIIGLRVALGLVDPDPHL